MEIAQQYEVDKNTAQAELNRLSRKLADITNVDDANSIHRPKRRRTRESPPVSDEDVATSTGSRHGTDERFVFQVGHKFSLVHALWLRSVDDLFNTKFDEHYDAAERFQNDKNKIQGQLKEILNLLQVRFQQPEQVMNQKWFRRQVGFIHI